MMSGDIPGPLPRVPVDLPFDPQVADRFGFALDDESWIRRVAECAADPSLGRLGPYELLAEVGRGGQGVVFKARQPGTDRLVAIKRLNAGALAGTDALARFRREVRVAAALDHPGIVAVYGCELIDGQPVMLMKWVDGLPIDQWAATAGRRGVGEILAMFERVCDAIHHAHQRGIIHRDVKPSNILIDAAHQPHVLDFGLAKLLTADVSEIAGLTLTGFIGTPAYVAPELARGESTLADVRTDVYALGVVLYQALCGSLPFDHRQPVGNLLRDIQERTPRPPSSIDRRVDRELDAIILHALEKDPERRYSSVDALRADVQRYRRGEPIVAHPASRLYQLRKLVGRHRVLFASGAAVMVLLLIATLASTALYVRALRATALAERQTSVARHEAALNRTTMEALVGIIEKLWSYSNGRRSVRTSQIAKWIAGSLDGVTGSLAPDAEYQLQLMTGKMLRSSRQARSGLDHLTRARDVAADLYGRGSPQWHTAMHYMQACLVQLDRLDDAEANARGAIVVANEQGGWRASGARQSVVSLASILARRGRYAEAEPLRWELIAVFDESGPADAAALRRYEYHEDLQAQGRNDEARGIAEEALALLETAPEANANVVAQGWQRLAASAFSEGDYATADALYGRAADYRLTRQGLLYWRTSVAVYGHAETLFQLGDYARAISRYQQALVWSEHAHGRDSVSAAQRRFRIGACLLALGENSAARLEILRALTREPDKVTGDAAADAAVDEVVAALHAADLTLGDDLVDCLGEHHWLVDGALPDETVPDPVEAGASAE